MDAVTGAVEVFLVEVFRGARHGEELRELEVDGDLSLTLLFGALTLVSPAMLDGLLRFVVVVALPPVNHGSVRTMVLQEVGYHHSLERQRISLLF